MSHKDRVRSLHQSANEEKNKRQKLARVNADLVAENAQLRAMIECADQEKLNAMESAMAARCDRNVAMSKFEEIRSKNFELETILERVRLSISRAFRHDFTALSAARKIDDLVAKLEAMTEERDDWEAQCEELIGYVCKKLGHPHALHIDEALSAVREKLKIVDPPDQAEVDSTAAIPCEIVQPE